MKGIYAGVFVLKHTSLKRNTRQTGRAPKHTTTQHIPGSVHLAMGSGGNLALPPSFCLFGI